MFRILCRRNVVIHGIDYVFQNQGELFRINNLINSNVFACCRKAGKEKIKGHAVTLGVSVVIAVIALLIVSVL